MQNVVKLFWMTLNPTLKDTQRQTHNTHQQTSSCAKKEIWPHLKTPGTHYELPAVYFTARLLHNVANGQATDEISGFFVRGISVFVSHFIHSLTSLPILFLSSFHLNLCYTTDKWMKLAAFVRGISVFFFIHSLTSLLNSINFYVVLLINLNLCYTTAEKWMKSSSFLYVVYLFVPFFRNACIIFLLNSSFFFEL